MGCLDLLVFGTVEFMHMVEQPLVGRMDIAELPAFAVLLHGAPVAEFALDAVVFCGCHRYAP